MKTIKVSIIIRFLPQIAILYLGSNTEHTSQTVSKASYNLVAVGNVGESPFILLSYFIQKFRVMITAVAKGENFSTPSLGPALG